MWEKYLPKYESQKIEIDSKACVVFSILNAIEILLYSILKKEINLSDRYIAVRSGGNFKGLNPKKIFKTIQKYGVVEESVVPFDSDYYSPIPDLSCAKDIGLKYYTVKSPFLFWRSKRYIKKSLKKSPLVISVFAWSNSDKGYTRPPMFRDNHFVVLYGYEEGKYWYIYDSYEPFLKKLDWNYPFTYIYGINIKNMIL